MVSFILPGNSASGEYEVANSLRFEEASTDSLEYDQSTPTNAKIFTISIWAKLKEHSSGNAQELFAGGTDGSNETFLRYTSNETIQFRHDHASDTNWQLQTNRKFRDPAAWYHIVANVDTTQGTDSNRAKIYVNGVQETSLSTANYPAQNEETFLNKASATVKIGQQAYANSGWFSGYMCEMVFIDGQALDPTSFGEFDSDSPNIWKPIDVSGLTFGTNGFYLNVPGPSTGQNANGMGGDSSGNDNHFASSGLSAVDRVTDTCTNNFATLNPLDVYASKNGTLSEGNTKLTVTTSNLHTAVGTIAPSSGKWYWEVELDSTDGSNPSNVGITNLDEDDKSNMPSKNSWGYGYNASTGDKQNGGTNSSYGDSYTSGDIIGVAMDLDNGAVYFSKNGTFQASGDPTSGSSRTNAAFTFTVGGSYAPYVADNTSGVAFTWLVNFGNPAFSISSGNSDGNGYGNFEYSVPSGYYAINTKNLAEYG